MYLVKNTIVLIYPKIGRALVNTLLTTPAALWSYSWLDHHEQPCFVACGVRPEPVELSCRIEVEVGVTGRKVEVGVKGQFEVIQAVCRL